MRRVLKCVFSREFDRPVVTLSQYKVGRTLSTTTISDLRNVIGFPVAPFPHTSLLKHKLDFVGIINLNH